MRAVKRLLIEAENPHVDKIGSIYLDPKFDNALKAKQVFPIVDAPRRYDGLWEKGDSALIHFNIVVFTLKDGKKISSHYNFYEDVYWVPNNMLHAIIKKDGEINMLDGWILIKPIKKSTEKVLDSGIILVTTDKNKIKHSTMRGVVYKTNEKWSAVPVGAEVLLTDHSDYSVTINNEEFWLVKDGQILAPVEALDSIGKYED